MLQFTVSRADRQFLSFLAYRFDIHGNADTVFQQFIRLFQQEECKVERFLQTGELT